MHTTNKVLVIEDNCCSDILELAFNVAGFEIELIESLPTHINDPWYNSLVSRIESGEFCFIVCDGSVQSDGSKVIDTSTEVIPLLRKHFTGIIVANSNNPDNRRRQMNANCDREGIMTDDKRKNWNALVAELRQLFDGGRVHSAKVNAVAQAA